MTGTVRKPTTRPAATEEAITEQMMSDRLRRKVVEGVSKRLDKDTGITKAVEEAVNHLVQEQVSGLGGDGKTTRHVTIKDTMLLQRLRIPASLFDQPSTGGSALNSLLGHTHVLTSSATLSGDGRHAKVVLCFVHDKLGFTRRGIEVRLLAKGTKELLDRTLTDDGGLALLRMPTPELADGAVAPAIEATVKILGTPFTLDVLVPSALQHAVADLEITTLPDLPTDALGALLPPPLGDDPLERLPADFTPVLAEAIVRLRGATRDPILGNTATSASGADFRGRRTPVIKSMVVARTGPDGKRYLVTLRQEWVFLGYTLGELKQVTSLDPGQVLSTVTSTLERTVSSAQRSVDEVRREALSMTRSTLSQLSSIDSLVTIATRNAVSASTGVGAGIGLSNPAGGIAGGIIGGIVAGPVGAIIGGLIGGGAGVSASTTTGTTVLSNTSTSTNVDTSLVVNSALQTAQSAVNTAISTASQLVQDLSQEVTGTIDTISPLLSRVTNLIRWTMYENYAVISRVEDVVGVTPYKLDLAGDDSERPVFSDEDIVELRRWFQPALLEPRLAPQFDTLAGAVANRVGGGIPVTTVHLEIDYSTSLIGGVVTLDLGESRRRVQLPAGSGSVRVSLSIPPTLPSQLDLLELSLHAEVPRWGGWWNGVTQDLYASGSVQITRIRAWLSGATAGRADLIAVPGDGLPSNGLAVTTTERTHTTTLALPATAQLVDTTQNPLFRHVNRNRNYYLSVLFEAARQVPSLRVDTAQLRDLDTRIWDLPLYGFDGDEVLVLQSVDTADKKGYPSRLVKDGGAATIVQLAAPGAYSEALQGLLQLEDAAGMLHPILDPPNPVLPPVAMVDLDKKSLVPIQQEGTLGALNGFR